MSVNGELSSRFVLIVDVNDGVGNGCPVRINSQIADGFVPSADVSDVKFVVENKFSRSVSFRKISREYIAATNGNYQIIGR